MGLFEGRFFQHVITGSFVLILVLLSASVGVSDWLSIRVGAGWNAESSMQITTSETIIVEYSYSIVGTVTKAVEVEFGLFKAGRFLGSFKCSTTEVTNVWRGSLSTSCGYEADKAISSTLQQMAMTACDDICDQLKYEYERGSDHTCAELRKYASDYAVSDPAAPWKYNNVCVASMGIFSVMIGGMMACAQGLYLACRYPRRLSLIAVASAALATLCAIAVISYGAAVSSNVPWRAVTSITIKSLAKGADTTVSNVVSVSIGFGLAIGAAVLAAVMSALAFFVAARKLEQPDDDDVEMSVVQAMPAQHERAQPVYSEALASEWRRSGPSGGWPGAEYSSPYSAVGMAATVASETGAQQSVVLDMGRPVRIEPAAATVYRPERYSPSEPQGARFGGQGQVGGTSSLPSSAPLMPPSLPPLPSAPLPSPAVAAGSCRAAR